MLLLLESGGKSIKNAKTRRTVDSFSHEGSGKAVVKAQGTLSLVDVFHHCSESRGNVTALCREQNSRLDHIKRENLELRKRIANKHSR